MKADRTVDAGALGRAVEPEINVTSQLIPNMSAIANSAMEDVRLQALAEAVGLGSSWQNSPEEIREAYTLATTYVTMLPAEVDAHVAPWVFPADEAASR
ncbi:hypothetical protein [Paraburkholderia tropica]|uniref:hypothetical protein n=1 Tax=Paraburkholderia tropica TaxID=92647 RepID=UPI002AB7D494|nr:hypothetical protein [Paraburkholderia tropica]